MERPSNLYVEQYELKFKNYLNITCPFHPFKKTYLPFFREMTKQITKQMIGNFSTCKFIKAVKIHYVLKSVEYIGDSYIKAFGPYTFIENRHVGQLIKLHKDGYAYALLNVFSDFIEWESYLWIRWKSHLAGYEYIEADNELPLKSTDIEFEICPNPPEEYVLKLQGKNLNEIDCNDWVDFINNIENKAQEPKKDVPFENALRIFQKISNRPFPFNASKMGQVKGKMRYPFKLDYELESWPDVIFEIWLKEPVTPETLKSVESTFHKFGEKWNGSLDEGNVGNENNFIDYMSDVEKGEVENMVQIHVDFGWCEPEVLFSVLEYLKSSKISIEKVVLK